ncbi:MAG: hypothetical protein WDO73_12580 [Ignavibacteriota bacterium]
MKTAILLACAIAASAADVHIAGVAHMAIYVHDMEESACVLS